MSEIETPSTGSVATAEQSRSLVRHSPAYPVIFENGKVTSGCPKTAGIYYWRNNIDGKGYVGETVSLRRRMNEYRRMETTGQIYLHNAIQKHGFANFTCYKLMDCCPNKLALHHWETHWIRRLNTLTDNGCGYNMKETGKGGVASIESRKKMSEAQKKRPPITAATRQKLRDSMLGRVITWKDKIGDANRGKKKPPISDAHREKLCQMNAGTGNPFFGKKHSPESIEKQTRNRLLNSGKLYTRFFVFD